MRPWLTAAEVRLVQALDDGDRALRAHGAHLLRRGPLRVEQEARLPGAGQHLVAGAPQDDVVGRELLAHALQLHAGRGVRRVGQLLAAARVLLARSLASVSSVERPRLRPASSAPSTLTSNQLSIERETNW
jgi:hypothetical protein